MDVSLALLADYANMTADGKLNILGLFDTIVTDRFPAVHPQMQLIFQLEAHPSEAGKQKQVEVRLMTEDGRTVLAMSSDMALQLKDTLQPIAEMMKSQQIIGFHGVRFEKPGTYQFAILVNGDTKKTISLKVQERKLPQAISG